MADASAPGAPRQPLWTRLAFAFLAVGLVAVMLAAARAPVAQGAWSAQVEFRGQAPAAGAEHAVGIVVPAGTSGDGLALAVRPAAVSLRPLGPLDGTPYRVTLTDAQGRVGLDGALDPGNPQNAPHGPPVAYLGTGAYTLRVRPESGEGPVPYAVEVTIQAGYLAAVEGWAVPPLALLLLAVPAAGWALLPGPGTWARLRRRRGEPPQNG